jgi:hypothetical protein
MSKVKVKKVKIPLTGKDEGISDMFNNMLGAGAVNLTISYPKYLRIRNLCSSLIKVFLALADSPYLKSNPEFAPQRAELHEFCKRSTEMITELFSMDLSEYEWNLETVDEEIRKKFTVVYEAAKKSKIVNTFIITCDRLVPFKQNFNDLEKLNPKFITCMAGAEWCPFPFSSLNYKVLFSQTNIKENNIRFFMTILFKVFDFSHKLWQETMSPDVDVDQFVDVIMNNIDEIKKRAPELNRCGKAFKKIAESVQLLKSNFNNYYRDFVETKDSTSMMQSFIMDVSKQTNSDPEVMREFREIIKYYKKLAKQQPNNPKMKALFDKVSDSFKQLEKGTTNLTVKTDTQTEDDSDPIEVGPTTISEEALTSMLSKQEDSKDGGSGGDKNSKPADGTAPSNESAKARGKK